MYEKLQSELHEERNTKNAEIQNLFSQLDDQDSMKNRRDTALERENQDLRERIEFCEKELESKSEFIQKQTQEQESDRQAQEDQIQMLQLALDRIKDKNKVSCTEKLKTRKSLSNSLKQHVKCLLFRIFLTYEKMYSQFFLKHLGIKFDR